VQTPPATLKAKEEGKTVAYTFIVCWMDEIMRAMDMCLRGARATPGYARQSASPENSWKKPEAENFPAHSARTRTCNLGFDIWREELGGEMH